MTTTAAHAALFARTSTATLVQSGLTLDARTAKNEAERKTYAWICDEIETRCGGITEEQFESFGSAELTYLECLLLTFPGLTT